MYQKDRRSVDQRLTVLYPLSYGAAFQVAPVGFEPTTPGLRAMYSNRQSILVLQVAQRSGYRDGRIYRDVVPAGSWASIGRRSDEDLVRT